MATEGTNLAKRKNKRRKRQAVPNPMLISTQFGQ
jgi:hypothetical protein